jgi:hypothetical protein
LTGYARIIISNAWLHYEIIVIMIDGIKCLF